MFSDNVSLQNKELISASQSGDVMTVVSLLNSGADVQTNVRTIIITVILFTHMTIFYGMSRESSWGNMCV